jgi:RNA polymerase sigma-70 factor (ECF subfamily)
MDASASLMNPGALVARVAASGDDDAFRELYEHFAPRVVAYLRRAGCAPDVAEELMQEVMAQVWRDAARYDATRAQVSTWIFCVARSRFLDRVRRNRRPEPDPTDPTWVGAPPSPPDASLEHARDRERLVDALASLSPEQASVLEATYVGGQSFGQYAARTGIPLGTVKTRARLALAHLRELLQVRPSHA